MDRIIGICNLHDDPNLGELTKSRPCGAVTFLGRYGLVDFTLSNFSNSGIDRVYVLVKNGILAMRNHIGSGSIWTTNTRRGFIKLFVNEEGLSNPKFNTDVANMKSNLPRENIEFDYAIIAPSFMLANIDYRPIAKEHIESGADVTVVYSHMHDTDEEYINCDSLKVNANKKVTKVEKNIGKKEEANISLESFVVSKAMLEKIVMGASKVSMLYNFRDLIRHHVNEGELNVHGYEYEGYVVPILSLNEYVRQSLNLLSYHNRNKLFLEDWPIYTTTHNTPPALYGKNSDVQNSFIANGSIIKGKVRNCIISRDVVIEEGAELENCIIFTKTEVGKNAKLSYVLTDKHVIIKHAKELKGEEGNVLFISQGVKV